MQKSISLDIDTMAALDRRGSHNLSGRIQTIIAAWTDACRIGLRDARRTLTRAEAQALLDVLNGTVLLMPGSPLEPWISGGYAMTGTGPDAEPVKITSGIAHNIADAIEMDGLAEKWDIDGRGLLDKLAGFDRLTNLALVDWAQIMWDRHQDNDFWQRELAMFRGTEKK